MFVYKQSKLNNYSKNSPDNIYSGLYLGLLKYESLASFQKVSRHFSARNNCAYNPFGKLPEETNRNRAWTQHGNLEEL